MKILGDPHNFGKAVCLSDDGKFVIKPRTVYWEELFLTKSSFRQYIDFLFLKEGYHSPFLSFPILEVVRQDLCSGHVEFCKIEHTEELEVSDFEQLGIVIAFLLFMGIIDLHSENIFCGKNRGKFYFFPIDIECVFKNTFLSSQLAITPSPNIPFDYSSISNALSKIKAKDRFINYLPALMYGYLNSLEVLEKYSAEIFNHILVNCDFKKERLREVFRPTYEYDFIQSNPNFELDIPLTEAEKIQLDRGDIPFFYTYPFSEKVLWESKSGESEDPQIMSHYSKRNYPLSRLATDGSMSYTSKDILMMRKFGSLHLVNFFSNHFDLNGKCEYKDVLLTMNRDKLFIDYKNLKVATKRF